MLNQSEALESEYKWSIENSTPDEFILIFVCVPICAIGFVLSLLSAYILSDLKENLYAYLRIEFSLMALDLVIIAVRSLQPLYMCPWLRGECSQTPPNHIQFLYVYVFIYLPGPIEAAVLTSNIFSALNGVFRITHRRSRFKGLIMSIRPIKAISASFAFFSLLFLHQVYFYSTFDPKFKGGIFNKYWKYLELASFILRDGILICVIVSLSVIILVEMKSSFRRKMSILNGVAVRSHARRSRSRINLLILSACTNTIFGRLPILIYLSLCNFLSMQQIPYILSLSISALTLSYLLKFFVTFHFNKPFRVRFYKIFHLSKFCSAN